MYVQILFYDLILFYFYYEISWGTNVGPEVMGTQQQWTTSK